MATRVVEGKKPYTGGIAIEVTEDKVINLRLRDENNLIIYDSGDNEIYVDLQLPDEIQPTDAFPVGITTGRVIVDNGWDLAGTIIVAETTSGDNIKILYADEGTLWMDNGTGTFRQIYFANEVDALLLALRQYIDEELAKKVNLGPNAVYDQDVVVDLSFWEEVPGGDDECGHNIKLDPKGQIKVYNSTVGGGHEVTIDGLGVEITDNTVLGGDQTAVLNYDGIVYSDTNTNEVYAFKGNNRIARLNDLTNVKVFTLADTSDLTNAQAAYDWYTAGKTAIISLNGIDYFYNHTYSNNTIKFKAIDLQAASNGSLNQSASYSDISLENSNNVVTAIRKNDYSIGFLATDRSNNNSYVPTENGHPANKKYVDDNITVKSGDTGTTYTIKVANADPASGTPATTITFVL